jgi:hypothetical protein
MRTLIRSFVRDRKSLDVLDIILLLAIVVASSSPLILVR